MQKVFRRATRVLYNNMVNYVFSEPQYYIICNTWINLRDKNLEGEEVEPSAVASNQFFARPVVGPQLVYWARPPVDLANRYAARPLANAVVYPPTAIQIQISSPHTDNPAKVTTILPEHANHVLETTGVFVKNCRVVANFPLLKCPRLECPVHLKPLLTLTGKNFNKVFWKCFEPVFFNEIRWIIIRKEWNEGEESFDC